jgi:lambda repressor-like predicted transcriptional regulator
MAEQDQLQFDPIDWEQMRILARLTPGERMMAMARASAFGRALLRGAFRRRYPDLPIEEINMRMLRYLESLKERGL